MSLITRVIIGAAVVSAFVSVTCAHDSLAQGAQAVARVDGDSVENSLINELIDDVRRGNSGAEARFWTVVSSRGTPLIDSVPNKPSQRMVTFVYKGDNTTRAALAVTLQNDQLANADYYPVAHLYHVTGTSVWFRTYRLRSDARFSYRVGREDSPGMRAQLSNAEWQTKVSLLHADSLNPRQTTGPSGPESVVELPDAPKQPWIAPRPNVASGTLTSFTHTSALLGDTRRIQVYLPAKSTAVAPLQNLVVVLDGDEVPSGFAATTVLDNLIAAGRLGPTAAIMIGNATGARVRDLWFSEKFARAIRDEILPAARAHATSSHAVLPSCPSHCSIAGRSLGGSAAIFIAHVLPNVFGGAISQSGGMHYSESPAAWNSPQPSDALLSLDFENSELLSTRFATSPLRKQRIYLEVGTMEDVPYQPSLIPKFGGTSLLVANRHLRDVLTAKGYALRYHEFNGNHREITWIGTLGDALEFVFANGGARPSGARPRSESRR